MATQKNSTFSASGNVTPTLSPESAGQLREILSDRKNALGLVRTFACKLAQEAKQNGLRDFIEQIVLNQYDKNINVIFDHAESPIESIFFTSFLCSCLKNGVVVVVTSPPPGAFREAAEGMEKRLRNLFRCNSYYRSLPDGARPESLRRFMEITGVERGELSATHADFMANEACVMFDLGFVHALHLCLQPTFNGVGAKAVRADAVLWIPSNPSFRLVVECDGFEYHGSKDAFSKDRSRDRDFQSIGYQVRRYSGAEIHHQPIAASADLVGYLIDQGRTKMTGAAWEKRAVKGQRKPTESAILAWKKRLASEVKP